MLSKYTYLARMNASLDDAHVNTTGLGIVPLALQSSLIATRLLVLLVDATGKLVLLI